MSIRADCGLLWKCASGNCGTDRMVIEQGAENLDPTRARSGSGWATCSTARDRYQPRYNLEVADGRIRVEFPARRGSA